MRITKFRAWDAKYNQMLYGGEFWKRYPNWYPVDYVTNKGVTIWNKRKSNDPEHTWEFQRLKMNPEISIMEFTGLLDKNGREIYEGDILRNGDWVGSVVYEAPEFKFNDGKSSFSIAFDNFEVTDNIYETSLTVTK